MITSPRGKKMIQRISPIYAKSEIEQAIYQAIGTEWDFSYNLVDEVLLQLFPQTATWGLTWWEQRYKLPTNLNEDIEIRRRKVIARMQSKYPLNPERMGNILSSYTGVNAVITEAIADSTFGVTLVSKGAFNINIDQVMSEIKRIKPSHLAYSLGLETPMTINVSSGREFVFNPLNMCGQFNCGDGIVISSYGRSFLSTVNSHVDINKNIKEYLLTGEILAGINSELESGIATIGRVYSVNENIRATRDYLYDNQLSKTDGYVIGSLYAASIRVAGSCNNAINTYDEVGNNLAGEFMAGSTETQISTLGRLYQSDENIQTEKNIVFDTELNKSSLSDPIVGSLNTTTLQTKSSSEDGIKDYSLTGSILVSTNVENERGETTIGKTYDSTIQENSNETNLVKEYNQAGDILASTEVVI